MVHSTTGGSKETHKKKNRYSTVAAMDSWYTLNYMAAIVHQTKKKKLYLKF